MLYKLLSVAALALLAAETSAVTLETEALVMDEADTAGVGDGE